MYQLDLWRCVGCGRILGSMVLVGPGSHLVARCWSDNCKAENVIDVPMAAVAAGAAAAKPGHASKAAG